jgi:hypothetical protein
MKRKIVIRYYICISFPPLAMKPMNDELETPDTLAMTDTSAIVEHEHDMLDQLAQEVSVHYGSETSVAMREEVSTLAEAEAWLLEQFGEIKDELKQFFKKPEEEMEIEQRMAA